MVSLNLGPDMGSRNSAPAPFRRRRPARSKTVSLRSLNRERRGLLVIIDDAPSELPASRSECRGGMRPCPFVSCRFHLYLDVNESTGSIKLNFPDKEPWELSCSCALDVAEQDGGRTLEDVGALLNLTRERARQLESSALQKIHDEIDR